MNRQGQMLYALQWIDINTGETRLCEVEGHVVYHVGSKLMMLRDATRENNDGIAYGWPSRYRAVPLPWTGPVPRYAQFGIGKKGQGY